MQTDTEQQLTQQILAGDTRAYGEIINRYKNALYYHCFAITRNEALAEDAAAEALTAAFYALDSYDTNRRLSTWLFKIATNKALDQLRKKRKHKVLDECVIERIASIAPEPQVEAEYGELHTAVGMLRPEYRSVVSLHYWQGLSCEDISKVMQKPQGTIKSWLKRAKAELRKELA